MGLSKKVHNLVIYVDIRNLTIKFFRNVQNDFKKGEIEEFVCDREIMENKDVFAMVDTILKLYLLDKLQEKQSDVYFVLPSEYFSIDYLTIPISSQRISKEMIKTELKKYYTNYNDLEFNTTILSRTKKTTTYSVVIIPKKILQDCASLAKKYGLNLKNVTYDANCLVNSFSALGNRLKHSNYILVNITKNDTSLIYVSKDKTMCFEHLPYGSTFLDTEKVNSEISQYNNTVADFEIYKIRELAKQKKIRRNGRKSEKLPEIAPNIQKEIFIAHQKEIKLNNQKLGVFINNQNSNMSCIQKNFRPFLKQILLMQQGVVDNYFFPKPEYAIINSSLPILQELVSIPVEQIKLKYLPDEITNESNLNDYLDIYGVLYAVMYNKGHNFLDKEKQSPFNIFKLKFLENYRKFMNEIKNLFKKKQKINKNK